MSMEVIVTTIEQLHIAREVGARRIYVELPLARSIAEDKSAQASAGVQGKATEHTDSVKDDTAWYVALPHITREETAVDIDDLHWVAEESASHGYAGVLARNLEQVGFLKEKGYAGKIVTDASLYVWNNGAVSFLHEVTGENLASVTLPYELSYQELAEIRDEVPRTMVVYGRIPMMVSANCVQKTIAHCIRQEVTSGTEGHTSQDIVTLTDRLQHPFPVLLNCRYCYNVILNTVPLSLHKQLPLMVRDRMAEQFRVDLTTERAEETEAILRYWKRLIRKAGYDKAKTKVQPPPYEDYTTGNYRRSAE